MTIGSGGSRRQRDEEGGVLEGSWVWIALPVGILVLIAALWFLVIAPAGGPPPRATVTPLKAPTAWPTVTPMVGTGPTQTPPPTPAATATPPAPASIGVGARVQVTGTATDKLRMRQSPGTNSVTVKLVPDGTQLIVTSGPEEASGYTWWKVQDQAGAEGWVAGKFLALLP